MNDCNWIPDRLPKIPDVPDCPPDWLDGDKKDEYIENLQSDIQEDMLNYGKWECFHMFFEEDDVNTFAQENEIDEEEWEYQVHAFAIDIMPYVMGELAKELHWD